ncbi:MAG: S-layer homology domain-containing protein [Anaerolineales bacterium]|nr:S-layer homology domain-containing protein [Anaerolineales bacterium]
MGGENDDIGRSIALDFNDNIYTTGEFSVVVDFDPGTSIYNMVSTGSTDIFISKTKSHIFTDVPLTYWANNYIERLYHAGITGGCGVGIYCPDATVTRAQMAVFLLKGMHGSSYIPPAVGITTGFGDVAVDYWACLGSNTRG